MGATHLLRLTPSPPRREDAKLRLYVIYTTPEATQAGLRAASLLAKDLGANIELLVAQVVPYPLPLQDPATPVSFTEQSVNALVRECGMDVCVTVVLCRDREGTIPHLLPAESIAVVGRRRRWGPGSSRGMIRLIRREGHHVIVVNAGQAEPAAALLCRRRVGG